MPVRIKVKKIHPDAKIPSYAHPGDAAMDLFSCYEASLHPGERKAFGTGLQFEIPVGYEMQIRPRSGNGAKHGVTVLNAPGTIDAGYRGEVKVILINHSNLIYGVRKGDKIAQGKISRIEEVVIEEAETLSDSERGENGLGSTGR